MNLKLIREPSTPNGVTFGELSIEQEYECLSLEDKIRAFPNKVPKETAIWGDHTYEIVLDYSPKFGKVMPHVIGVLMFTGIRIHPVRNEFWTEGCIGVGYDRVGEELRRYNEAYEALLKKLVKAAAASERMFITIIDPVEKLKGEGLKPV